MLTEEIHAALDWAFFSRHLFFCAAEIRRRQAADILRLRLRETAVLPTSDFK
jgi:hypothetical protein